MSGKEPKYPRQAPAAGPSPEGSPVFFGVTMPRRRPQGWWCSRGFDDLDDEAMSFDEFIEAIYADDLSDSNEDDEFEGLIEYYDNQRW